MNVPQHAHLFRNRHRLAAPELAWASRRLAMLDGHHVAQVHGRHGVIRGFEIVAHGGTRGPLVVGPGTAFTPCGDLVVVACATQFDPPDEPGVHEVWLDFGGRVIVGRRRSCRPTNAVYLGSAEAVVWAPSGPEPVRWRTSSPTTDGRLMAADRRRAHVAAGTEHLRLSDLDIDVDTQTASRRVVTANGQFERTPLYFASVGVEATLADTVVDGIFGWFIDICSPTSDAFTARLHIHPSSQIELLNEFGEASNQVVVKLTWLGVDPARDGVRPADPTTCTSMPMPDPVIIL